jgi:hypothetical protein
MNDNLAQSARDYFARALRTFYFRSYKAYCEGEDDGNNTFLPDHMLRWEKWRENEPGLPDEVYAAHLFYVQHFTDQDIGSDRVYLFTVDDEEVYAVRTTTDGDDSFVELYDGDGEWLAAGRSNLEIMAWGSRDWLRKQAEHPASLPPELKDSSQQTLWGKDLEELEEEEEESPATEMADAEDELPADARKLVDQIAKQKTAIEEEVRSQVDTIQSKVDKKKATLQQKADKEIDEVRAEGDKKLAALLETAAADLKALQLAYAKKDKWDEALAIREHAKQLENKTSGAQPDPGTMSDHEGEVGKSYYFTLTGTTSGSIWGTDVYTTDSSLAASAVHAGKLRPGQTKAVKVTVVQSPNSFRGSTRNGVTTNNYGSYPSAYRFG